jgi:hypothetical protein
MIEITKIIPYKLYHETRQEKQNLFSFPLIISSLRIKTHLIIAESKILKKKKKKLHEG